MQVIWRWQQASLQDVVARSPPAELLAENSQDTLLIQSVAVKQCLQNVNSIILDSNPCEDAVAVVEKTTGHFCLACSAQRSCRHVRAISGDGKAEAVSLEARQQAFLQKFESIFDSETGRHRVTSISQASCDSRYVDKHSQSLTGPVPCRLSLQSHHSHIQLHQKHFLCLNELQAAAHYHKLADLRCMTMQHALVECCGQQLLYALPPDRASSHTSSIQLMYSQYKCSSCNAAVVMCCSTMGYRTQFSTLTT